MKYCVVCGEKERYGKQKQCKACYQKNRREYERDKRENYQQSRDEFLAWYHKTTPTMTRDQLKLTKVEK